MLMSMVGSAFGVAKSKIEFLFFLLQPKEIHLSHVASIIFL